MKLHGESIHGTNWLLIAGAQRLWRWPLATIALLAIFLQSGWSQISYNLEIVAHTGGTTPAGSIITSLGSGPSINDAGRVAYTVAVQSGREGVYVSGEGSARSLLIENFRVDAFTTMSGLSSNFRVPNEVAINNQNRIAWTAASRDGLFAFTFRLGSTAEDYRIVAKTYYDNASTSLLDLPSPFVGPLLFPNSGIKSQVSLNNAGRTVFPALLAPDGNLNMLGTPVNPETSGHNRSEDFHIWGGLAGNPRLNPVISDAGYTLVRAGGNLTDPLVLFTDPTFAVAWTVAKSPDFTAIGEKPGISDDSRVVAFSGVRASGGVGVYGEAEAGVFKIVGTGDRFSTFYPAAKVAVNRSDDGRPNSYTVAFIAGRPDTANPGATVLGLYTVRIDITNPAAPAISPPRLVVEAGMTIPGLTGTVTSISLADPLNNKGQLAFWVSATSGAAIVKASVLPVILVYGWHGSAANWDLLKAYLEMDDYPVNILSYDDSLSPPEAASALSVKVDAVLAARGVTKVNLIAHSYGGLVARHYIEEMGQHEKVENLIMMATPNHGSRLADYITGTLVDKPQAELVEYLLDFYSAILRTDRTWGSTLAMRTIQNPYLDNLNLMFGSRLSSMPTHYHVIAGTAPYPTRFTSHAAFLQGADDGVVAGRSARLPGVPIHCVPLNHSAIVNPRLVLEYYDSKTGDFMNTEALDQVLAMYLEIIRPILEGTPPPSDTGCVDASDPNDSQLLPSLLRMIGFGVHRGDVVTRSFDVDAGEPAITITFTHRFSDFDLTLRSPSGQVITRENFEHAGGVTFAEFDNSMTFTVNNPQPGQWQLVIGVVDVPDAGEDLSIYVLGGSGWLQPAPPLLEIRISEGRVILSWDSGVTGFLLEFSTDISTPASWSTVPESATIVGSKWVLELPLVADQCFYRLRSE